MSWSRFLVLYWRCLRRTFPTETLMRANGRRASTNHHYPRRTSRDSEATRPGAGTAASRSGKPAGRRAFISRHSKGNLRRRLRNGVRPPAPLGHRLAGWPSHRDSGLADRVLSKRADTPENRRRKPSAAAHTTSQRLGAIEARQISPSPLRLLAH